MQYTDWGERAARWSGIRSETVDVHGTKVHYLVTDQTRTSEAPVHLLVPNPANSASNWLDVLAELRPRAHAIAVDLPGTIAGHTALPNRRAAGVEANALFLLDFAEALELDRVVVHGWSAGGMIALLFADQAPERVRGLVLVDPALPPPLSDGEARMWQTLGRAGLAIVAPVALVLLRVSGRRLLAAQLRVLDDPASIAGRRWNTGGDLTRMSPEIAGLLREEMSAVEPTRLGGAVTVYASLMSLMFVRRRPVLHAMRRVASPTLLVCGDEDRLIPRASIDDWTAQRPDWNLVVLHRVGHAPPFEVPADYARTVIDWCGPRVHDR
ncbi:alpha/beta fold hydrolase [Kribbella sindirgiensis]|uniref:Alpha/beta hydrolase n=1 Tax=Kribbella sindirgiensis TaxID=1124744 RepID=A0A4R0IFU1_9ACTN|nr:alpha/beta hydrolase [Kribbella sindirgiensis]TCC32151.1 alpha/beta hydrolase [Kribbella sindirgiensis]